MLFALVVLMMFLGLLFYLYEVGLKPQLAERKRHEREKLERERIRSQERIRTSQSRNEPRNPQPIKEPTRERDKKWVNTQANGPPPPPPQKWGTIPPTQDSSIEDLIENLNHPNFCRLAADLLAQRGSTEPRVIKELVFASLNPYYNLREACLQALKSLDQNWLENPAVLNTLPTLAYSFRSYYCELQQHDFKKWIANITKTLCAIGEPAAPHLAALIAEKNEKAEYKIHAMRILRDIGPNAVRVAKPQLIQAMNSKTSMLRSVAADTLAILEEGAK
jgi:hypothetical protein